MLKSIGKTDAVKAWVKFRGSDGFIFGGYNVSSVTRVGAGVYQVNFTEAMPDANFAVIATPSAQGGVTPATMGSGAASSPSAAEVYTSNNLGAQFDPSSVSVAVFR
jgi:hypothetical protein